MHPVVLLPDSDPTLRAARRPPPECGLPHHKKLVELPCNCRHEELLRKPVPRCPIFESRIAIRQPWRATLAQTRIGRVLHRYIGKHQCRWRASGLFDLHSCHVERSVEHTSELQSRLHLVCRLLLEKKTDSIAPLLPTRFLSLRDGASGVGLCVASCS